MLHDYFVYAALGKGDFIVYIKIRSVKKVSFSKMFMKKLDLVNLSWATAYRNMLWHKKYDSKYRTVGSRLTTSNLKS
jgi:hypothetical protein